MEPLTAVALLGFIVLVGLFVCRLPIAFSMAIVGIGGTALVAGWPQTLSQILTIAWAKGQGADTSRTGITGFCWGGRITWLYAAHSPQVKAGVAWYGRVVGQSSPLTPKHPVDVVGSLHGPVLGLYGEKDTGIPLDSVDRMKAALAAGSPAARRSELVIYPDAPHAFHADYRPSYRKEAAEDGWKRCLAWFKAHGVA